MVSVNLSIAVFGNMRPRKPSPPCVLRQITSFLWQGTSTFWTQDMYDGPLCEVASRILGWSKWNSLEDIKMQLLLTLAFRIPRCDGYPYNTDSS